MTPKPRHHIVTARERDSLVCSNCGKHTDRAVMSPNFDPKRRNQCPQCAREWMWPNKQLQWEEEFNKQFYYVPKNNEEAGICSPFYAAQLKFFIHKLLYSQLEEIMNMSYERMGGIGRDWKAEQHEILCGFVYKLKQMKDKIGGKNE